MYLCQVHLRVFLLMDVGLYEMIRWTLFFVVVPAFLLKVRRPSTVLNGAANYRMVPRRLVRVASVLTLATELAICVLLLASASSRVALGFGCILFLFFAAAIYVEIRDARSAVPCGCLGSTELESGLVHVGLNLILAMLTGVAFVLGPEAGSAQGAAQVAALIACCYWLVLYADSVLRSMRRHGSLGSIL